MMRARSCEVTLMKRVLFGLVFVLLVFVARPSFGQQPPEIRYTSVPDFLKLPADVYLGEVAGVAVNSKGHVFVFSRGNSTGPAYAASGAQLLEFDANGNFCGRLGTTCMRGRSRTR